MRLKRKQNLFCLSPMKDSKKSAATVSDNDASQSLPSSEELCSPWGYNMCKRINSTIHI